jgi:hypothetical protein
LSGLPASREEAQRAAQKVWLIMTHLSLFFSLAFLVVITVITNVQAGETKGEAIKHVRALGKSDGDRIQVQHAMTGPRDTVLFYPYYEQRAVVLFGIANTKKDFPVKGVVYLFPLDTTKDGIDKWINNQHSDGLYVDPAKISEEIPLPAEVIQVQDLGVIGQETSSFDQRVYDNHRIKLTVKEYTVPEKFVLSALNAEAQVFLPAPKP